MAVTIGGEAGYEIAKLVGVSEKLLEAAKVAGFKMEQKDSWFYVKDAANQILGTAPMKGTFVTLLKQGQMGPTSKAAAEFQIKTAIEKGLNGGGVVISPAHEPELAEHVANKKVMDAITPPSKKKKPGFKFGTAKPEYPAHIDTPGKKAAWTKAEAKKAVEEVAKKIAADFEGTSPDGEPIITVTPSHDASFIAKLMKQAPVKLADATAVYQAVSGSTKVYYVLALMEGDMKLAARVEGNKASFRVEGPNLEAFMAPLKSMGFEEKGNYASVHLDCGNAGIKRTYGAILGAIGFQNIQKVGDIGVIGAAT